MKELTILTLTQDKDTHTVQISKHGVTHTVTKGTIVHVDPFDFVNSNKWRRNPNEVYSLNGEQLSDEEKSVDIYSSMPVLLKKFEISNKI